MLWQLTSHYKRRLSDGHGNAISDLSLLHWVSCRAVSAQIRMIWA
jgi:hypothetical protein